MAVHAIETIGVDADDTLWHNEVHFHATQERLAELVADYADREALGARLIEVEHRNVRLYGYGIKGFTLSMIEAAIDLSKGAIGAARIRDIIGLGQDMLATPIEPLPGVAATLEQLRRDYRLVVITKGDLLDQEAKIARSGLGELVDDVFIVSEKAPEVYLRAFGSEAGAARAAMIGNSLKSDILPALVAGAWGVHIPYHLTWALEHVEEAPVHPRFRRLDQFDQVPGWLKGIGG
ncbi:MAG: HAD family hydrolase [Ancalomicrobiaceae bacterium]|nr:HAD family hydrolase [Ancalomicrobiaceae bacterium]